MMRSVTTASADAAMTARLKRIQEALDADNFLEALRLICETEAEDQRPGDDEAIRAFASALPQMQRTCLTLHTEGDRNEVIAQKMGIPVETVHHMLSKILLDLRIHLGD